MMWWCDVEWNDEMWWCDVEWCDVVWNGVTRCGVKGGGVIQNSDECVVKCDVAWNLLV